MGPWNGKGILSKNEENLIELWTSVARLWLLILRVNCGRPDYTLPCVCLGCSG